MGAVDVTFLNIDPEYPKSVSASNLYYSSNQTIKNKIDSLVGSSYFYIKPCPTNPNQYQEIASLAFQGKCSGGFFVECVTNHTSFTASKLYFISLPLKTDNEWMCATALSVSNSTNFDFDLDIRMLYNVVHLRVRTSVSIPFSLNIVTNIYNITPSDVVCSELILSGITSSLPSKYVTALEGNSISFTPYLSITSTNMESAIKEIIQKYVLKLDIPSAVVLKNYANIDALRVVSKITGVIAPLYDVEISSVVGNIFSIAIKDRATQIDVESYTNCSTDITSPDFVITKTGNSALFSFTYLLSVPSTMKIGTFQMTGNYVPVHTHLESEITNLDYPSHGHDASQITNLTIHNHNASQIVGLTNHRHDISQIDNVLNHNHPLASPTNSGLMHFNDKTKLDLIKLVNGKIDPLLMPPIALHETHIVNSEFNMFNLMVQLGDICIRTDIEKTFIVISNPTRTEQPFTDASNWQELITGLPKAVVTSVNGRTGIVNLLAEDIVIEMSDSLPFTNVQDTLSSLAVYKSDIGHTHPTLYYTKEVIDSKLPCHSVKEVTGSLNQNYVEVEIGFNKEILNPVVNVSPYLLMNDGLVTKREIICNVKSTTTTSAIVLVRTLDGSVLGDNYRIRLNFLIFND